MEQLGLNFNFEEIERKKRVARSIEDWDVLYDGWRPEVGGLCCVENGSAYDVERGEYGYFLWAPCVLDEKLEDDKYLVHISYSHVAPEFCKNQNGKKLVLDITEIGPLIFSPRLDHPEYKK